MSYRYSKDISKLRKFKAKLESKATSYERVLRTKLKASFLFQHIEPPFILDFVNLSTGLVIELDGSQHYTPEGIAKDKARTKFLEQYGYTVLRFKNSEVEYSLEKVLAKIELKLKELRKAPKKGYKPNEVKDATSLRLEALTAHKTKDRGVIVRVLKPQAIPKKTFKYGY